MNKITVAICTWNRSRLLDQTLSAMHHLRIPEGIAWELLVVNNNCNDDTDETIARHRAYLPIRRLFEPKAGLSHARNCALDTADGELIVWTDDDVLVDTGWLAAVVDAARRYPDVEAFGGPIKPWFPVQPDPVLVSAFPAMTGGFCRLDYALDEETILSADQPIYGANMAFRMSALAGLRFDPRLGRSPTLPSGGEDVEFISRLRARGGRVLWVPAMWVRHYVAPSRMTLDYLTSYYTNLSECMIRLGGMPEGVRLMGVPRWVLRMWLEASLLYWIYCVIPNRAKRYWFLRRRCQAYGMLRECLAIRRAGRARFPSQAGAGAGTIED